MEMSEEFGSLKRRFAGYLLGKILSEGEDGSLIAARGLCRGERITLRLLNENSANLEQARLSALSLLKIRHPGVIPPREVGVSDGRLYMASPYVIGASLEQVSKHWLDAKLDKVDGEAFNQAIQSSLEEEPQLFQDSGYWRKGFYAIVADLFAQLAKTLDELHQMGISHGELKPRHLLVTPIGRALISYFPTSTAAFDPQKDLQALGQILRETLLFFGPELPEAMDRICYAATTDCAADRYSSCGELVKDLHRFLIGEEVVARRPGALRKTLRKWSEHPARAAAGFILLLAATGAMLYFTYSGAISREAEKIPVQKPLSDAPKEIDSTDPEFDSRNTKRSTTSNNRALGKSYPRGSGGKSTPAPR